MIQAYIACMQFLIVFPENIPSFSPIEFSYIDVIDFGTSIADSCWILNADFLVISAEPRFLAIVETYG